MYPEDLTCHQSYSWSFPTSLPIHTDRDDTEGVHIVKLVQSKPFKFVERQRFSFININFALTCRPLSFVWDCLFVYVYIVTHVSIKRRDITISNIYHYLNSITIHRFMSNSWSLDSYSRIHTECFNLCYINNNKSVFLSNRWSVLSLCIIV